MRPDRCERHPATSGEESDRGDEDGRGTADGGGEEARQGVAEQRSEEEGCEID